MAEPWSGKLAPRLLTLLLLATSCTQARPPSQPLATIPPEVATVMRAAVRGGVAPGAALEVGTSAGVLYRESFGTLSYDEGASAVSERTLYDLASLTKVVATTTLVMRLEEQGALSVSDPIIRYVPDFQGPMRETITIEQALTHSTGLPAWAPLYQSHRGLAAYVAAICDIPLECPPGTRYRYSDLGLILLAAVLERATSCPLEDLVERELTEPLGLRETRYTPEGDVRARCAPTELCKVRGRMIQGEVHDENTFGLGGVSTHAGLFSTASDLGVFCRMLLSGGLVPGTDERYLERATIDRFTAARGIPGSHRTLGWQRPHARASSGKHFSERAFGHTGFTGTSLWLDPEKDLYVVLLTNRVHPTRENKKHIPFRRALHDVVHESMAKVRGPR